MGRGGTAISLWIKTNCLYDSLDMSLWGRLVLLHKLQLFYPSKEMCDKDTIS